MRFLACLPGAVILTMSLVACGSGLHDGWSTRFYEDFVYPDGALQADDLAFFAADGSDAAVVSNEALFIDTATSNSAAVFYGPRVESGTVRVTAILNPLSATSSADFKLLVHGSSKGVTVEEGYLCGILGATLQLIKGSNGVSDVLATESIGTGWTMADTLRMVFEKEGQSIRCSLSGGGVSIELTENDAGFSSGFIGISSTDDANANFTVESFRIEI